MGIFNERSTSHTYTCGLPGLRGPPGIGYELTPDGNYNMENKKLTNLKPGQNDNDILTKKQLYDHIKANGGDSSTTPVDLTDYIKKDTSTGGFSSDLTMNNQIISGLKSGSNSDDAINKNQLDIGLKTKANKNELNNYLKTDGSNKMLAALNMDNRRIENVGVV